MRGDEAWRKFGRAYDRRRWIDLYMANRVVPLNAPHDEVVWLLETVASAHHWRTWRERSIYRKGHDWPIRPDLMLGRHPVESGLWDTPQMVVEYKSAPFTLSPSTVARVDQQCSMYEAATDCPAIVVTPRPPASTIGQRPLLSTAEFLRLVRLPSSDVDSFVATLPREVAA